MSAEAKLAFDRVLSAALENLESVCWELDIPVPARPRAIVDLVKAVFGVNTVGAAQLLLDALHAPRIREKRAARESLAAAQAADA
jgi:hypothetical protein